MTEAKLATAAKDALQDAKTQAKDTARDAAETAHERVVAEAEHSADAAHQAADAFAPGSLQAAALGQLAQGLESVTQTLSERSIDGLADDVALFARRNPMLFLGGAALAGFAAARFLKSSPQNTQRDAADPWSNHLSDAQERV